MQSTRTPTTRRTASALPQRPRTRTCGWRGGTKDGGTRFVEDNLAGDPEAGGSRRGRGRSLWVPGGLKEQQPWRPPLELAGAAGVGAAATAGLAVGIAGGAAYGLARGRAGCWRTRSSGPSRERGRGRAGRPVRPQHERRHSQHFTLRSRLRQNSILWRKTVQKPCRKKLFPRRVLFYFFKQPQCLAPAGQGWAEAGSGVRNWSSPVSSAGTGARPYIYVHPRRIAFSFAVA